MPLSCPGSDLLRACFARRPWWLVAHRLAVELDEPSGNRHRVRQREQVVREVFQHRLVRAGRGVFHGEEVVVGEMRVATNHVAAVAYRAILVVGHATENHPQTEFALGLRPERLNGSRFVARRGDVVVGVVCARALAVVPLRVRVAPHSVGGFQRHAHRADVVRRVQRLFRAVKHEAAAVEQDLFQQVSVGVVEVHGDRFAHHARIQAQQFALHERRGRVAVDLEHGVAHLGVLRVQLDAPVVPAEKVVLDGDAQDVVVPHATLAGVEELNGLALRQVLDDQVPADAAVNDEILVDAVGVGDQNAVEVLGGGHARVLEAVGCVAAVDDAVAVNIHDILALVDDEVVFGLHRRADRPVTIGLCQAIQQIQLRGGRDRHGGAPPLVAEIRVAVVDDAVVVDIHDILALVHDAVAGLDLNALALVIRHQAVEQDREHRDCAVAVFVFDAAGVVDLGLRGLPEGRIPLGLLGFLRRHGGDESGGHEGRHEGDQRASAPVAEVDAGNYLEHRKEHREGVAGEGDKGRDARHFASMCARNRWYALAGE